MAQELPQRTGLGGPTLVRALSRVLDTEIHKPDQPLPERLGDWLAWTDAIALASALGTAPSPTPTGATVSDNEARNAAALADYVGVKAMLERMISDFVRPAVANTAGSRKVAGSTKRRELPAEYSAYRQRYASIQQDMESAVAALRARLRLELASRGPGAKKLAVLDATIEQALADREYEMLGAIPNLLEEPFRRLTDQQSTGSTDARNQFHKDLEDIMQAELKLRLQPADGLLAALQVRCNTTI